MLTGTWQNSAVSVYWSQEKGSADDAQAPGSNDVVVFGKQELLNNRAVSFIFCLLPMLTCYTAVHRSAC